MIRVLKKGLSSVYFQYGNTGESIGAKYFNTEIIDDTAIIRFDLNPIDSNQRDDE